MLICNRALENKCSDYKCKHRKPHEKFWWCEKDQECTTWGGGYGVTVKCVEEEEDV